MTQNQLLIFFCIFAVIVRVPRIVERWKAPLLRGCEWFFRIPVPHDFVEGPGAAILRVYRLWLFLPWAIELPIAAVLVATHHAMSIFLLAWVITLYTRVNYYWARRWAEGRAQAYAVADTTQPVSAVALSLRPRTLAAYTNKWFEATICLSFGAALCWLLYRYAGIRSWKPLRDPAAALIFGIYLQAGMLMMKRAIVHARTPAPAHDAQHYLEWRDSLRRLTIAIVDYSRVSFSFIPLLAGFVSVTHPWQGSTAQAVSVAFFACFGLLAMAYEWMHRARYIEITRHTRPASFLPVVDLPEGSGLLVFRPSLPIFILSRPKGYTFNLASTTVRFTGLWIAGYAALVIGLAR
jgi:hypothetical protein